MVIIKKGMKKLLILFILANSIHILKAQNSENMQNKFNFKSLYSYAIQEDVKSLLSVLDTLPDTELNREEILIKEKYYRRFRTQEEVYEYNTAEKLIKDMTNIYRDYWTSVLLKQKSVAEADTALFNNLKEFLLENSGSGNRTDISGINSDPLKYFSGLLTEKGYFCNVEGKTGNLYDIYIWQTQDTTDFNVALPDENIRVSVIFMKDIITLGWEEYATFGYYYPGGWPKDSLLYCVAKAYDITEEKFTVSYLTHEAQHFQDIKKYEEIPSWHLEYRAKLAVLSRADETMSKLLAAFLRGAKNDSTLSHPYAEYCVIRDLSKKIFGDEYISDTGKWDSVEIELIKKSSAELLRYDTSLLTLKNN